MGSRLIAAGGQSQVEGLERHRPLLLLPLTRRPTFSLEVGWLKGRLSRLVRVWAGSLRVASVDSVSSRTLATDRDWLFGLSVVVVEGPRSGSLSPPPSFGPSPSKSLSSTVAI